MKSSTRASAPAHRAPVNRLRSLKNRFGILACGATMVLTAVQPLFAHDYKAGSIEIEHPWSRAIPQGAKVAAGYLELKNNGTAPDRLVSVTAEIAGRVEIHEMAVDDKGVMTMRPMPDGVALPAGSVVALKPGSYHIMFLDLKSTPVEGKRFKGTLLFEKAGSVDVEYAVEPIGGKVEQHDHSKAGG